jgi:hypothetical protein
MTTPGGGGERRDGGGETISVSVFVVFWWEKNERNERNLLRLGRPTPFRPLAWRENSLKLCLSQDSCQLT